MQRDSVTILSTMSSKTLRSETIRHIDQNATDFIVDRKKSNNLVDIIGYLEVDCTRLTGHSTPFDIRLSISICM